MVGKRWHPWLAAAVFVASGAIGISFLVESAALGGSAMNGHASDGHYFVGSHGGSTQVSEGLWTLSLVHGALAFASLPFAMFAMFFLLFRYVFPFLMSGSAPARSAGRVALVRASGPRLWSGSPGGSVGTVNASAGLLDVEVFPGGIVAKPLFMSPFAVPLDEIRSVRLGRRLLASMIEIEHRGVDVTSPLVIYGAPDSPQATVLTALVEGTPGLPIAPAAPTWPPPDIVRR